MPESIPLPDLGWRGSSCIAYVRPSAWQKAAVGFTAERLRLRLRLADEEEKPTQEKGPVDHYPLPFFSNVLLPTPPIPRPCVSASRWRRPFAFEISSGTDSHQPKHVPGLLQHQLRHSVAPRRRFPSQATSRAVSSPPSARPTEVS